MYGKLKYLVVAGFSPALILAVGCCDPPTKSDTPPPPAVTNLAIIDFAANSVTLSWTVAGDDSMSGTAAAYDIRYATVTITEANWDSVTQVIGEPKPKPGGDTDTMIITGLSMDTTYYFALKTKDEAGNWSAISNVVSEEFVVSFPDPNLEAVIREKLQKPAGDIYASELLVIHELWAGGREIAVLTGLEYCGNLEVLYLWTNQLTDINSLADLTNLTGLYLLANQISDISPLARLINLEKMWLGYNEITDLSPLAGLINLESLLLDSNQITDLSPLVGLINLESLLLSNNQINDISPLAVLTNLVQLHLDDNQINDIGPLASLNNLKNIWLNHNEITNIDPFVGLTNLRQLYLSDNQISEICPLNDNAGLGYGDVIRLWDNPLSDTSCTECIPALQARGAEVGHDCP